MNSRERILTALEHGPVDRVPIDLDGTRQSGIAALAYERLRRHLNLDTGRPVRVFDVFQMLAEVEPEVLERFGSDTVAVQRPKVAFGIANRDWKPCTLPQGIEVEVPGGFEPVADEKGNWSLYRDGVEIARMPRGSYFFDRFEKYPGASKPALEEWEAPRLDAAALEHYGSEARRLNDTTERAVIIAQGPPYELFGGMGQGDFEEWMVTFASETDYVEELYRKCVDAWIENLEGLHAAVGDNMQVLQIADDFGTQSSTFMSPSSFRELIAPAYKRGLDWVHAKTNWKVVLHSDGALVPLLPDICAMGVDALNPVQTSATGMDPAALKREFGERLVFWGGSCDAQSTLDRGSPEDVVNEVKANLEAFGPLNGGHVFASIHNIQATVPPENIVALFDTALSYKG